MEWVIVPRRSSLDLASLVPRWLVDSVRNHGAPVTASREPLHGAVMAVDISGFSQLTREYQRRGEAGVEDLSRIIGDYLGSLINDVLARGGDIDNLYGDALLVLWNSEQAGCTDAVATATRCAAELVARHDHVVSHAVKLRIRAAVVAGPLCALQTGGVAGRWEFALGGSCLLDVGPMLERTPPGYISLSPFARAALPGATEMELPHSLMKLARTVQPGDAAQRPAEVSALNAFAPRIIVDRNAMHTNWLAEFRVIATLFVGIPGLRCDETGDFAPVQETVTIVQHWADRLEGTVLRVSMNDKGPLALIAFGLPNQAHDDDACRAIRTAENIIATLAARGLAARASITFGATYCGMIGNRRRQAYTAMGDTVNRAAKLLGRTEDGHITCDAAIANAAEHRMRFRRLEDAGTSDDALFEPERGPRSSPAAIAPLIGRDSEMAWLRNRVDAAPTGVQAPVVYLEGDAGIGKSTLVAALRTAVKDRVPTFTVQADPLAGSAYPLAVWRDLLLEILQPETPDCESWERELTAVLTREGMPAAYLNLVRPLLPSLLLPAGEPVSLPAEDVARVTREVLALLLRARMLGQSILVIIEDVHWMDSASWLLAAHLANSVPGLHLLLTSRPDTTGAVWWGPRELAAAMPIDRLVLQPLADAAIRGVIGHVLGADEVDSFLVERIQVRAAGNPLFAAQLASALREQDAVSVRNGRCIPTPSFELTDARLPQSIQRTIISRVDRLQEDVQITLKAASVLGASFSGRALRALLRPEQLGNILGLVSALTDLGIVRPTPSLDHDLSFAFQHGLVQEAVYQLLPFKQRHRLHAEAALFFEGEPPHVRPAAALIGLHWTRASQPRRALPWWEQAGIAAMQSGAQREAATALSNAVAAIDTEPGIVDRERTGRIRRMLGDALLQTGEVGRGVQQLIMALRCFGYTWPGRVLGAPAALVQHALVQAFREMRPNPKIARPLSEHDLGRAQQASLAFESLGQALGHSSKLVGMVAATLAALNISQRTGDAAIYSRSAGLLSLALLLGNLRSLAARYLAHSRSSIPEERHAHDRLMTSEYIALFFLSAARLHEAEAELRTMLALAARVNNNRRLLDATSLMILALEERGEHEACRSLLCDFEWQAKRNGDPQVRCWMHLEATGYGLLASDLALACRHLSDVEPLLPLVGRSERVWAYGLMAACCARRSDAPGAVAAARAVMREMTNCRALAFYAQYGVFGAAEVFLDMLEGRRAVMRPLNAETRLMMRRVALFGMRMSLTKPRTLALLGRYAHLCGGRRRAIRLTTRALDEAIRQEREREIIHARDQLGEIVSRSTVAKRADA